MFDAETPTKPNSTPGAIEYNHSNRQEDVHKESLPDLTQGDYDVPIL